MDYKLILEVVIRTVIAVAFMFILAKMEGPRLISQLTFYDYVVGITIGSIAAAMAIDFDIKIEHSLLAMLIFVLFAVLISVLTTKSIFFRRLFTGEAVIVINDGKVLDKALAKIHFDINDLLRELRNQGYFDTAEVAFAIFETNGKLSVLPKAQNRELTPSDMQLSVEKEYLCANVIIDGKFMKKNLECIGKSEGWLFDKLKQLRLNQSVKTILLATVDKNDELEIYFKGESTPHSTMFQ